jgi:two-component system, NtrC family, response regulator AtoC
LTADDLPERVRNYQATSTRAVEGQNDQPIVPMDEIERRYVMQVLGRLAGNKTMTAQMLGMDRRTLYRKIERWEKDAKAAVTTHVTELPATRA